jgi:hypothetical protein
VHHRLLLGLTAFVLLAACRGDFESTGGSETSADDAKTELCEDYCTNIGDTCTGDFSQYGATQQCLDTCMTLDTGNEGDELGNSIECRLHYALQAAENPEDNCRSAGPGGDGVCGSNCEGFCQIQSVACTGDLQQFPTITDCVAACNGFDASIPYDSSVVDGDSLACRLYHLTVASTTPAVHCPHIVSDSPVCL